MNVFSRKTNISAQLFKLVWLILVAQLICTSIPRLAGNELPINTDRVQAVPWHFDSAGRQVINYHNAIHICPLIFFVDESFLMLSDSFSSCQLYLHRSLWMYLSSRPFFSFFPYCDSIFSRYTFVEESYLSLSYYFSSYCHFTYIGLAVFISIAFFWSHFRVDKDQQEVLVRKEKEAKRQ